MPLTILMVDKYHFVKGGAERYMFELTALLESQGHRVIPFAMRHPANRATDWERHFVSHASFGDDGPVSLWQAPRLFVRAVYNLEARRALQALLREVQPDVAHLHMIDHQISPSILPVLRAARIPIVQTVHHYKAVCPSYRLYNERTGEICERCVGRTTWHAVRARCHKASLVSSMALALESAIHRATRLHALVDLYHAPSRFAAGKLEEGGLDPGRIRTFFYAIDVDSRRFRREATRDLVYFGRLSPEKGLLTLLEAMRELPGHELEIAGEGPLRPTLEQRVQQLELRNVRFLRRLETQALEGVVGNARLAIVPSEWHENSPLAIYEAFALGTPVVASRTGGIPELVREGETGALFERADAAGLARKIEELFRDPERLAAMRARCRALAEQELDWSAHYPRIEGCYRELIARWS
ncbi:MAG: glycosyltransferase [Planctomycetota bacterium]